MKFAATLSIFILATGAISVAAEPECIGPVCSDEGADIGCPSESYTLVRAELVLGEVIISGVERCYPDGQDAVRTESIEAAVFLDAVPLRPEATASWESYRNESGFEVCWASVGAYSDLGGAGVPIPTAILCPPNPGWGTLLP